VGLRIIGVPEEKELYQEIISNWDYDGSVLVHGVKRALVFKLRKREYHAKLTDDQSEIILRLLEESGESDRYLSVDWLMLHLTNNNPGLNIISPACINSWLDGLGQV